MDRAGLGAKLTKQKEELYVQEQGPESILYKKLHDRTMFLWK